MRKIVSLLLLAVFVMGVVPNTAIAAQVNEELLNTSEVTDGDAVEEEAAEEEAAEEEVAEEEVAEEATEEVVDTTVPEPYSVSKTKPLTEAQARRLFVVPDEAEGRYVIKERGESPASPTLTVPPLELRVHGRYIYNSLGEEVKLTGANIPDLNWATGGDNDLWRRVDMMLDHWNGNSVRLGVHSRFWYAEEWYQGGDSAGYKRRVDDIIRYINSKGKYVILNLHEFWTMIDRNMMFWKEASQIYRNNPGVLFGMLNEPHSLSWDVWRNGGEIDYTDEFGKQSKRRSWGHQEILEIIRGQGARNIVLVGGLDWGYYVTGWIPGTDGLERGYQLEEPKGANGNGIIIDSHIYPMKPEYNPPERALDSMIDSYPIFIGEVGHWGERRFDWFDDYNLEWPHVWNNNIYDYMERNQMNYSMWCFHVSSSPPMFLDYETFEPTKYTGWVQKHRMLSEADSRPPVEKRVGVDPTPLAHWYELVTFDEDEEVMVFGDDVQVAIVDSGHKDSKGMLVNFDIKKGNEGNSGAVYHFPEGTSLAGTTWLSFRIKGDGDMREIGIGLELTDGRVFKSYMPIDLFENWKLWFLPLDTFKGLDILDTTMIDSIYFTSNTDGPGSFTIDDICVAGYDYKEYPVAQVNEETTGVGLEWTAWGDSESEREDSFTADVGEDGIVTSKPIIFRYDRPEGSFGGQARAAIPPEWYNQLETQNMEYFTFWAKGDGSDQQFTLRFDNNRTTTGREQRSNFWKREFDRFAYDFKVTGDEWTLFKIPIRDIGMSDIFHRREVRFVNIFNRIHNKRGTLIIDGFGFTNERNVMDGDYTWREPSKKSEPIGEIKTKYARNKIFQIPREWEVTAGEESYLHVHFMNKTDRSVQGEMRIEGLPMEYNETANYDSFAHYVSYPHYPWREYSLTNFKVTIPFGLEGEYMVRVVDASDNGIEPQLYKLTVNAPKVIYD